METGNQDFKAPRVPVHFFVLEKEIDSLCVKYSIVFASGIVLA